MMITPNRNQGHGASSYPSASAGSFDHFGAPGIGAALRDYFSPGGSERAVAGMTPGQHAMHDLNLRQIELDRENAMLKAQLKGSKR